MFGRVGDAEHAADVRSYIEGRFIINGKRLAEELGVGNAEAICL